MTYPPPHVIKTANVAAAPLGTHNGNPDTIGLGALIAEDFRTHGRDWFSEGFWVLFWHRIGNWRMGLPKLLRAPMTLIYRIMFRWASRSTGILLPYTVKVGRRVCLEHFGGMILVAESIGDDVTIRQNTTFGIARMDAPHDRPVIGDCVEIGTGAVIVGAVSIGNGAIIGANSVVTRDVLPGMVVGGIPARVIGRVRKVKRDKDLSGGTALLHKTAKDRISPYLKRTYPTASVTGMPRAV
ncbi:hypothetical protein [Sedimentitalea sp.]|uniref:serine O-acetyltransferase n=1 Tax=Sedimentitalea sp. TaxID=2048915 RepID=UPI003298C6F1